MNSLHKNEIQNYVEKPKDCKLIDRKWGYKIKRDELKSNDKRQKA